MLKIVENHQDLAFYQMKVPAGFPSPADDYIENDIDLVSHLVKRPSSTFVMQITGDSMNRAGMVDGDYIVVDNTLQFASSGIDKKWSLRSNFKSPSYTTRIEGVPRVI